MIWHPASSPQQITVAPYLPVYKHAAVCVSMTGTRVLIMQYERLNKYYVFVFNGTVFRSKTITDNTDRQEEGASNRSCSQTDLYDQEYRLLLIGRRLSYWPQLLVTTTTGYETTNSERYLSCGGGATRIDRFPRAHGTA